MRTPTRLLSIGILLSAMALPQGHFAPAQAALAEAAASSTLAATPAVPAATSRLLGATTSGMLVEIDPTDATFTVIGPIGFPGVTGLAEASDGTLFAVTDTDLLTIDPNTGVGTMVSVMSAVGASGLPTAVFVLEDISFDPAGTLFGVGNQTVAGAQETLVSIDTVSAVQSFRGVTGLSPLVIESGLAFDAAGMLFHAGDVHVPAALIPFPFIPPPFVGIDLNTLTFLSSISVMPFLEAVIKEGGTELQGRINALAFSPDPAPDGTLFASNIRDLGPPGLDLDFSQPPGGSRFLVTIDPATGAATTVGATIDELDALAFVTASAGPTIALELREVEIKAKGKGDDEDDDHGKGKKKDKEKGKFEVEGRFTLTEASDGTIDPVTEGMSFDIGPMSFTIEPGLFRSKGHGKKFEFKGKIFGDIAGDMREVELKVKIKQRGGKKDAGQYELEIEGKKVDLSGVDFPDPITVSLTIGGDTGAASISPKIKD
ncbi:MAG: hypothetical protein ACE5HV_12250 [Acidobacteriota bacterium]